MSEELRPCPFCGETVSLDYSELPNKKHWYITCDCCGMMYQAVVCQRKDTKTGWNNRPIEDALNARIAEFSQAVGLITTLKPTMVMDTEHPLDMAKEAAEYVNARIAELEAEVAEYRASKDGGGK